MVKKKNCALIVIFFCIFALSGCNTETHNSAVKKEKISWNEGQIEWNVDLTGDGRDEKVDVNVLGFIDGDWEDGDNIVVYSGKTGEKIWSGMIADAHSSAGGLYLYQDDDKNYLVYWNPYTSNGGSVYSYKVYELTDEGEENVIAENTCKFDSSDFKDADKENLENFANEVNPYLEKSAVILDTNDGVKFSKAGEEVTNMYDYEKDIEEIQQFSEESE